ncbi:hypothetical protein C1H46_043288 [Malus baccata]|uniref:GTPase HflX N-terminal domain-containing protein n=1 Tax=Malus baccata TaxID=106549 RepID=A0A540KAA9_MALBA|nr:hypothetical protein C1H46_043288 [Malus baccata]
MSACSCCSLIRSSPLSHDHPISRPLAKLSRPIFSLSLRKQYSDAATPRFVVVRAVQPGLGVVEPGDVSVHDPTSIDVVETGNGEVLGVVGGVADAKLEDHKPLAPATRVRKKKEEEGGDDNRFKLRNGREVFEEKAYIVGVEHKRGTADSFGVEESLKELTQLADTAGLMVVGSTYQKLVSPNSRTYIGSGKVAEIKSAINALGVETVIFDDELSAGE